MAPHSIIDDLKGLSSLFDSGHLTASEFEQAKKLLLNDEPKGEPKGEPKVRHTRCKSFAKAKLSDPDVREFLENIFETKDIMFQYTLLDNTWNKTEPDDGMIIGDLSFEKWNGKKNILMCQDPEDPDEKTTVSLMLKLATKMKTIRALDHMYFMDNDVKVTLKFHMKKNGFDIN